MGPLPFTVRFQEGAAAAPSPSSSANLFRLLCGMGPAAGTDPPRERIQARAEPPVAAAGADSGPLLAPPPHRGAHPFAPLLRGGPRAQADRGGLLHAEHPGRAAVGRSTGVVAAALRQWRAQDVLERLRATLRPASWALSLLAFFVMDCRCATRRGCGAGSCIGSNLCRTVNYQHVEPHFMFSYDLLMKWNKEQAV
ncbi:uncharacterized protein LOC120702181 [Panicum virgatum]|uniref:uncharacterized protein LOC120702181 n=1 Tax=Panicum virgatum TaxID=38727 RepID=UPI0019D65D8E|nr:uncharacterized protein LOC120702181 [Panicum virgatum]